MSNDKHVTLVIKKIKKGGHGHHGGAWKVAYADFVTAMMAFFLLLWLLNSVTQNTLQGIADYFTPTVGLKGEKGIGFQGGSTSSTEGTKSQDYSNPAVLFGAPSEGALVEFSKDSRLNELDKIDERNFINAEKDISKAIADAPDLKDFKDRILFDQTPEGLRIQLLDNQNKPLFKPGTNELESYTKEILKIVGNFVKYMPNYLSIEGHTTPFQVNNGTVKDNWTLSAERANAARKFLNSNAMENEQVFRVVGKADQEPLDPQNPSEPRNIRISVIILKNSIVPFQKYSLPKEFLK
jgi:chemotaxis protein MotB